MSASAELSGPPLSQFRIGAPVLVFVLIVGLIAALAVEPTRQLLEQKRRIADMNADLLQVQTANRLLERRIVRLQDPDFVEQRAREQIGLVRPGEVAYLVMPPARKAARRSQRVRPPAPAPPNVFEELIRFIGF